MQFITIIRKREKDGSTGAPVMAISPDLPVGVHSEEFHKIVQGGIVSDDIAEITVFRAEKHYYREFETKVQAKEREEAEKKFRAVQSKTVDDAIKRKREQDKAEREREEAIKKKQVDEMNAKHDAVRVAAVR
jgi:hypothetical protein